MGKMKDLTGQTFNRLTVIAEAGRNKYKQVLWQCTCICGNKTIVTSNNLTKGNVLSCGCAKADALRKDFGESAFNTLFDHYKRCAIRRGYVFELTKDVFSVLTQSNCFYCGRSPNKIYKPKDSHGGYIYNGVDRFYNTKGYTLTNSVSCCELCNYTKNTMSGFEYLTLCKRVSLNWNNRDMETERKAA